MYKVKVNDQFLFEIENRDSAFLVNGDPVQFDLSEVNGSRAHVLYQHKSFRTEIVEVNKAGKTCTIKVNGNTYQISIEDQFDELLKQLGLDNLAANKVSEIKAPMPGLVLKVLVAENTEVKKGDNLLILEAMKMENILKSSTDGTVKKVMVVQGDKVEKNQVLVQFK
ncbi:biotin/lipoyl-binding protein [Pedobacter sp. HDW13]|uniref:acetyl-CoA carboxylase biotin carboxyl carrier protein subunit n=1 Tax=unclassified Pedobacter TaxID=2628915 RepID=UPI000F5B08CA|nr:MULTISPECIES: acetyl-CoA carboxylase biotin carboxyl carrier protein subunit [unclassified Pedobacter]QIL39875.1 biotin/lipoyl-binding protein [Pedobacter sp. HDW13]RQO79634.1 acetyl-CoA carboxylase biotin carboxyl carrier protein subunit [Pedobacter sp. KBW01]